MIENINNDDFINKILQRKIKRNIVYAEVDMSYMSMKNKIMFMMKKILSIKFVKGRLILFFWDDINKLLNVFRYHKVNSYQVIRKYKKGHVAPGILDLTIESHDRNFLKSLIIRQYGVDFSHKNSINIKCVYAYELLDGNKRVIYNYDDRGYREYFILIPKRK